MYKIIILTKHLRRVQLSVLLNKSDEYCIDIWTLNKYLYLYLLLYHENSRVSINSFLLKLGMYALGRYWSLVA